MDKKPKRIIAGLLLLTPLLLVACLHKDGKSTGEQPAPAISQVNLSVVVTGSGSVASAPANIAYGTNSNCSKTFDAGADVTLTALPTDGFMFSGWGGACGGTSTTCALVMNIEQGVTAAFSAATATGTAQLLWDAPTTSAPADVVGYIVRYGTASGNYTQGVTLPLLVLTCTGAAPVTCDYTVNGLTAATWYFAVQAYDASNNASTYSNEAFKTIP